MALRVVFVRHGESQANVDRLFSNRPGVPHGLTPAGIAEAEALAATLAPLGIAHVYTSPILRAVETASIISRSCGAPVTETDALREYDVGDYEGLPYAGEHAWRWDRYMEVEAAWRRGEPSACHPGGESLAELEGRFVPFMTGLFNRHSKTETIIAVSHGGFLRAVLPAVLCNITREHAWTHTLGHLDRVIAEHREGVWHCVFWIDRERTPREA